MVLILNPLLAAFFFRFFSSGHIFKSVLLKLNVFPVC